MNSTHLKSLTFLIGRWDTDGETLNGKQTIKIRGTDTYEWALDGNFILHRADVMMGDVQTKVIELIGGYDESRKTFKMWSFDNTGAVTIMEASVKGEGVLEIKHEKMRATLTASKGTASMNAHWEISEHGTNWIPWMQLAFVKN